MKIDTAKIENYAEMTAEEKLAALEMIQYWFQYKLMSKHSSLIIIVEKGNGSPLPFDVVSRHPA